jgi:hypothetical protein
MGSHVQELKGNIRILCRFGPFDYHAWKMLLSNLLAGTWHAIAVLAIDQGVDLTAAECTYAA